MPRSASLGSDFPSYVDAVDASGRTALAWAAAAPVRSTACVELLYANEARDDSATVDGLSVLHLASQGNARAVAYFVDVKSFDVDQRAHAEKRPTPLMLASKAGAVAAKACAAAGCSTRRGRRCNFITRGRGRGPRRPSRGCS